jgi:hypothetical protein
LQTDFANAQQKKFYYIKVIIKMANIGIALGLGLFFAKDFIGGL